MGAMIVRGGPSVAPVTVTAGAVNGTARLLAFTRDGLVPDANGANLLYTRPCLVTNLDADTAFMVRVNGTTADPATATDFDFLIPFRQTVDVSLGGRIQVSTLSIFFPTGVSAVTDAVVRGWEP